VLEFLDKVDERLQKIETLQQRPSQPTVISSKNRMLLVLPKLPITSVEDFKQFDLNLAEDQNIASAFVSHKSVKKNYFY
jgi:hypothetical protein